MKILIFKNDPAQGFNRSEGRLTIKSSILKYDARDFGINSKFYFIYEVGEHFALNGIKFLFVGEIDFSGIKDFLQN